ncbi:adenosylcobinamide-GDP ribazoletransferase [Coraliomargarita algicola]|uniref:Adenosylcobinamide-GDP ribazoletransferase n=1 Tax=Coraliomargarita algicola TaxID=3092156 RepID=A0ABZ0RIJ1_9BACT|nr:adenosylcobinamide-GDP ribazoletransferase [Coraliomargarita sp. J2-16]WPJ94610.1 adenosylcobinamide-GDP ribazoletransferase [Coraliomargarita sp. J2-16]
MLPGLITALRLLSILPIPGRESRHFIDGLPWYPAAGAVLGYLVCGVCLLAHAVAPDWGGLLAVLGLAASIALTRGLHLDGVADCADGFWGGHERRRRLEIMKDSRIGAFGVIALVLVLLGEWTALERMVDVDTIILIPVAFIVSRFGIVLLAHCFEYPRAQGTGAAVVKGATRRHLWQAFGVGLLLSLPAGVAAVPLWGAGIAMTLAVGFLGKWKIGGVSGDVLGAGCVLSEMTLLFAIVLGS